MKIVVNTPAGHVGHEVVDRLLAARQDVVLISRHPRKVETFVSRGARLIEGSMDDKAVLDRAFQGADGLFWLTPVAFDRPDYVRWVHETAEKASELAQRHDIRRALIISTVGAQMDSKSGLLECLWTAEQKFKKVVPNVTVLRPGSFMENFLNHVGTIAQMSSIFGRYPTSKKIPMVASRDVAEAAARELLRRNWNGFRIIELHGPEHLSQIQAAEIIGDVLGRTVQYIEVPEAQARQGMVGAGMPVFFVDLMLEMFAELNAGRMEPEQPRSADTTTRTTLRQFAKEVLKPAIGGAAEALPQATGQAEEHP